MDRETVHEIYKRRRAEKRKKRKIKLFKRFLFFSFMFALFTMGMYVIYNYPYFNITEISCTGNSIVSKEEIINTSGLNIGDNLFISNVKRAESNISKIPYINTYKIWKTIPGKINIKVTEAVPAAYIGSKEKLWIVDKEGKLLENPESIDSGKNIPFITGIAADNYTSGDFLHKSRKQLFLEGLEYAKILDSLELLNNTNEINIENIDDIKLAYDNRLYIYVGSSDTFEYKMGVIKKLLEQKFITDYEHAVLNYRTDKLYVEDEDMFSDKALNLKQDNESNI